MNKEEYYSFLEEILHTLDSKQIDNISEYSEMWFIEKHLKDVDFNFASIANNNNLTLEFLEKYEDNFIYSEINNELNRDIHSTLDFFLNDPHIRVVEQKGVNGLRVFYGELMYCHEIRCNNRCYSNFMSGYSLEDANDDLNYISFIFYDDKLYAVSRKYEEKSIDILISKKMKKTEYRFGSISLTKFVGQEVKKNLPGILLRELKEIQNKINFEFLDGIVEKKNEEDIFFFTSNFHFYKTCLEKYSKIDQLMDITKDDNLLEFVTLEYILKKHFTYGLEIILKRKDITPELSIKLKELYPDDHWDWAYLYSKPFFTKDFLLNNPQFIPKRLSKLS